MPALTNPPGFETISQIRSKFEGQILTLLGSNAKLWLPQPTDTTTTTERARGAHVTTWDASVASRLSALGFGYGLSFNGTDDYGSTPDADSLTFGGAAEGPMSAVVLANVTNVASLKGYLGKWNAAPEYLFVLNAAHQIEIHLATAGVVAINKVSTGTITRGVPQLHAFSYSGVGGATAASGITISQNAVEMTGTATNSGSYTRMLNGTDPLEIGAYTNHTLGLFNGIIYMVALCGKALTLDELWAIKKLVNAFYGLSL